MANNNEAKVRFAADTSGFNDSIKAANKELTSLRGELKLNEAQMRANGTSVEGLREKQRILGEQMEAAQDKTKALSDKLAVAVEIFGENSDEAAKLRNQLVQAQTAEVNLQRAINNCNNELQRQEEAENRVQSASEKLSDEITDQKKEIDKLKRAYVDAVLQFGEGSDEARVLADQIDDLSGELRDNARRMNDASRAADDLDRSLDEAEDRDEGGFTIMKGALADLASEGIQMVIGAVSDMISYFSGLPQETMELRQDFGTLTTAFENVGLGAETATDTWKELYKVFGEDDRAVETANNIARIADNEEELNKWVRITTGIWGTYQDSLPVEGLAEAAAETAKTGTVTGGLADALNWSSEAASMFAGYMSEDVVTAEDAFNQALAECSTEAERQALITDTLTQLYGGAADTYRDTTAAQMEAKESTAENILAEANLAAAIEPVTTEFANLKNEMLVGLMPAVEAVSGVMLDVLGWLQEHPVAAKVLAGVLGVVAAAFAALTIAITVMTVAQWAYNAAVLANPIVWIVVAIVAALAAVIAIIIVVIEYWDEIVAAVSRAVEAVKAALLSVVDWVKTNWQAIVLFLINPFAGIFKYLYDNFEGFRNFVDGVVSSITGFFSNLWAKIVEIFSPMIEWFSQLFSSIYESLSSFITVVIQLAKGCWEIIKAVWGIVAGWFNEKIIQPIAGFFSKLWSGVSETASNAWNKLKNGASQAWQGIKSVFSTVASFFKNIFTDAWEGVKGVFSKGGKIFSGITEGITSAFKKVVNAIISGINKVVAVPFNAINNVLGKIRSASIAGIQPFKSLGSISVPKIPLLAEGGILTQPTLNIAGEAGPEAIIPIDKLQTYIGAAIDRSMQAVNMQALVSAVEDLANRAIQLNVNGREFALATASDTDVVNGNRIVLGKRGLAL